jgi:hypothetical protein
MANISSKSRHTFEVVFIFLPTAMPTVVGDGSTGASMLAAAPTPSAAASPSPERPMTLVTAPTHRHQPTSSYDVQGVSEVGVSVSISDDLGGSGSSTARATHARARHYDIIVLDQ